MRNLATIEQFAAWMERGYSRFHLQFRQHFGNYFDFDEDGYICAACAVGFAELGHANQPDFCRPDTDTASAMYLNFPDFTEDGLLDLTALANIINEMLGNDKANHYFDWATVKTVQSATATMNDDLRMTVPQIIDVWRKYAERMSP